MKRRWILEGVGETPSRLVQLNEKGQPQQTVRPLLTVQDVCRLLRRSRRHVYRYLKAGRLRPCARILGQWLFPAEEATRFSRESLPSYLRPYFWDVALSGLSAEHHRDFVLGRILESGDRQAARWALEHYSRRLLLSFLRGRGRSILSERALHFWTMVLGEQSAPRLRGVWRRAGRHWGGIS